MSKDTVKISKARGRPMLTWVGKRPLIQVKAFPAQLIESFSAEVAGSDSKPGTASQEVEASQAVSSPTPEDVELRTDPKYGGFFQHQPLTVSVSVQREGEELLVTLNDVFSPGIVQRLNLEQGVFRAQVEDWRAVVDCILIDSDHDGEVFNVALSDIPPRKQDLVEGSYRLPAPRKGASVAVKVIDMLGEEAVVVKPV